MQFPKLSPEFFETLNQKQAMAANRKSRGESHGSESLVQTMDEEHSICLPCDLCDSFFSSENDLLRHVASHSIQDQFRFCVMCKEQVRTEVFSEHIEVSKNV